MDIDPLIVKALEEAEDALGALRRGHGIDVTDHCYPALNTVRDALDLVRGIARPEMPKPEKIKWDARHMRGVVIP